MNSLNILFTDLDGTLRQPKSPGQFITSPKDQQLIPGVLKKIKEYHDNNWIIVMVFLDFFQHSWDELLIFGTCDKLPWGLRLP